MLKKECRLSKVLMLVSLNLVQELILFYLSELQSTCVLNQKAVAENDYCYKSIMIEKELDTRFQEAVTIASLMTHLCPKMYSYVYIATNRLLFVL
jgi:hypothetical protein